MVHYRQHSPTVPVESHAASDPFRTFLIQKGNQLPSFDTPQEAIRGRASLLRICFKSVSAHCCHIQESMMFGKLMIGSTKDRGAKSRHTTQREK